MNPYVFVVGCPRSGTTLLRRMINAHPEIAITRETHWIPELAKGTRPAGAVTDALLTALAEHLKFGTLAIAREELAGLVGGDGAMSYADFVTALFDLYGARQGKRLVGDKTPGYAREIGLLHGLWPTARFVHLVRDGRDVCLSALAWERKAEEFRQRFPTWAEDAVATSALWWRWHVLLWRQDARALPSGLSYELRYESLVAEPEVECRRLCDFLDIRYDEAMVRFHEGRTKQEPGLPAKHAWLPPTPGLRDWRTQMAADHVERFEAAAGDALEESAYARAFSSPGAGHVDQAARIAELFPGRPLPEGW